MILQVHSFITPGKKNLFNLLHRSSLSYTTSPCMSWQHSERFDFVQGTCWNVWRVPTFSRTARTWTTGRRKQWRHSPVWKTLRPNGTGTYRSGFRCCRPGWWIRPPPAGRRSTWLGPRTDIRSPVCIRTCNHQIRSPYPKLGRTAK